MGPISGRKLREAIKATFYNAGNQDIPSHLPTPPSSWEQVFRRLAVEIELSETDIQSASALIQRFIDPILRGQAADSRWAPESRSWV